MNYSEVWGNHIEEVVLKEKRPCFNCLPDDTFAGRGEDGFSCEIGHAAGNMNCHSQEPFSLVTCREIF